MSKVEEFRYEGELMRIKYTGLCENLCVFECAEQSVVGSWLMVLP